MTAQSAATARPTILNYLPWILATGLILLAFLFQYTSIGSITVPAEEDFYRDLGAANAMLDGLSSADPNLAGEVRWYNPLTPAVVALASQLTGISTFDLYTHSGPLLNLLAPIFLFLLVARLHSPWAACFALAAYLFLGHHAYLSSRYATYSPWLWPFNFTQALAFLTLLALQAACVRERWTHFVFAGLLLGLTFLSHTAPAALIALATALLCGWQALTGRWSWQQAGWRLMAVGVPSLLVSLALLWPIYTTYRFHMLNPAPANFTGLFKNEVVEMLLTWKNLVAIPALLGIFGVVLLRRSGSERLPLFMAFSATAGALFLYGMAVDILRGKGWANLPLLVPTFHFHIYLTLCLNVAFGIGAVWLLGQIPRKKLQPVVMTLVLAGMVGLAWPGYSQNRDTQQYVRNAATLASQTELRELYDWCRNATRPEDVILADDHYGQYSIGASGRKVVVLEPIFTSPYVDLEARQRDRKALYEAIRTGDETTFNVLMDRYGITYVLTGPTAYLSGLYVKETVDTRTVGVSGLEVVRSFGPATLYRRIRP